MNVLCEEYMRQFDNATATVLQKQTFAECVRMVYPRASGVDYGSVFVPCMVAGILVTLFLNKERIDDTMDVIIFTILGMSFGVIGAVLLLWVLE